MKFNDVMRYYDYKMSNVARAIGVCRQYVYIWKKSDHIPYNMQCVLHVETDGKLKANKND